MNVNLQGDAKIHWTQTLMLQMLNEIVSAEQKKNSLSSTRDPSHSAMEVSKLPTAVVSRTTHIVPKQEAACGIINVFNSLCRLFNIFWLIVKFNLFVFLFLYLAFRYSFRCSPFYCKIKSHIIFEIIFGIPIFIQPLVREVRPTAKKSGKKYISFTGYYPYKVDQVA